MEDTMLRPLRTTLTIALVTFLAASTARAQTQPPPPPPAPWMPGPSSAELLHRGHRNKVAGGVMMGIGSLLLASSLVLNIVEVVGSPGDHHCDYFSSVCGDGTLRGPMWVGSMATFATGLPILGGGIAAYAVGGYQMRKARRMQLMGLAAAPTSDGSGLMASAAFRF
jgi:hypothetical protein